MSGRHTMRRIGSVLAIAALSTVATATAAQADDRRLDTDYVKVESLGYDYGAGDFDNNTWSQSGTVKYYVDENVVKPVIEGKLALFGVNGECARMRIDYYSTTGIYLTTLNGGTVCAPDNGVNTWSVNIDSYESNKIGKVTVSVDHLLSNGDWASVGSSTSVLSTYVDDDVVVHEYDGGGIYGIGFGGSGWSGGNPGPDGEMVWRLSGGQIKPELSGFFHVERVSGFCGRIRQDYYSDTGWLGVDYGGTVCANTNDHYEWSVFQDDFSHSDIRYVKISIESLDNNVWTIIDSTYSYFGT